MRRQTFADAGQGPAAGQALRLDPGALPVRYVTRLSGTASEAPAAIVLNRNQALVSQMRGGVSTVVTVPMDAFVGIAARFEVVAGRNSPHHR